MPRDAFICACHVTRSCVHFFACCDRFPDVNEKVVKVQFDLGVWAPWRTFTESGGGGAVVRGAAVRGAVVVRAGEMGDFCRERWRCGGAVRGGGAAAVACGGDAELLLRTVRCGGAVRRCGGAVAVRCGGAARKL